MDVGLSHDRSEAVLVVGIGDPDEVHAAGPHQIRDRDHPNGAAAVRQVAGLGGGLEPGHGGGVVVQDDQHEARAGVDCID